jgi:tetratricopeptide (TPR) repeat protein
MAIWAHAELVRIALEAGDYPRAVDLLSDGSRMPVDPATSRDMRRRAGQISREQLKDEDRALRFFQSVVDESIEDAASVAELGSLLEARNRLPDLFALRQRQLETKLDDETRLAVRLEVARVLAAIESQGGRIGALRQNLKERPGHEASIERLAETLAARRQTKELSELFTTQAAEVEHQNDPARAANLWSRAAVLLEGELQDVDGALKAHRKVVGLTPGAIASLDALARLHMGRGEPGTAAEWLKRRLEAATDEERGPIALRLAEAYLAAGNNERATQVLERLLASSPTMSDARARLAGLYRQAQAFEPLARLLAEGAPHEPDEATRLAYVREAAQLYEEKLDKPDLAIPVLQMGVELEPDDQDLKRKLALGLRVAGRLAEAREILEALAASYGRRRSPERAGVHFQLAQVAHAAGDLNEAMEQLDQAKKMDMSHPGILRMSGRMAFEAGKLSEAEKAYRALLLVVRRQDPTAEDVMVGASEVLYELSLLATAQKDEAQASELLESALSTAAQGDAEAERFKKDLVSRGEVDLALRAVEKRLKEVEEPASEARMLAHKAEILAKHKGKNEEALEALIKALGFAPTSPQLHEKTRALARSMNAVPRYVKTLRDYVDKLRRKDEAEEAAEILLRLGEAMEKDLGDLDGASEIYERVEKLGIRTVDAWRALARVADARGDSAGEVRVLERLIEADDASIPNEARNSALYRIAEVQLARGDTKKGLATLKTALDRDPRYAKAGAILQAAVNDAPDDDALLSTYEEVARASDDPALVLDYLERRAARPDATLDHVREGVDKADLLAAPERAEALLVRGARIASASEGGLRDALWVPMGVASRRRAAGDVKGALEWMRAAAEASEGDEQTALRMQVAELAMQDGGDLRLAAETYRSLLANDPGNRNLWGPLAQVYAKLRDRDGLEEVVRTTLEALIDPADRNELRMLYATFLLDVAKAPRDSVDVLKQVLDEDPDHLEAAQRLADLFEAAGDHRALAELLATKLDRARDRQDVEAIVQLSLRMGKLMEAAGDASAAMDHYRAGLDWAAQSRELLAALLGVYTADHDQRERAELSERLLQVSTGPEAARIANDLIALWNSLDDEYGAARALDFGFRACPSDASLRERLETYHRGRQEWAELAEVIAYDAAHRDDLQEATSRFREAAFVWRETMQSPAKAAEVMRTAWSKAPAELDLLEELVADLSAANMHAQAAEDVAAGLAHFAEPSSSRARLLRMRAKLSLTLGSAEQAVADLEEAYSMGTDGGAGDLIAGLDAKRMIAAHQGDLETERDATHRLSAILAEAGDVQRSRDVLAEWVERAPSDRDALRRLRDLDTASERWPEVARHNARLVHVEEGAEQVQAALALADASRRVGQPQYAREGLELVHAAQPADASVHKALRDLYEEIGAHRELAIILLSEAEHTADGDQKFELLRKSGELLVAVGDPEGALAPLAQAASLRPEDHELIIALSDAYMGSSRLQEAVELLQEAINGFKKRRSPALAAMQLRMARIAGLSGDAETQKEWLNVALESDKNNGDIAAELAELSIQLGDDDTALKALRVVTLQKVPGTMSKALAFLRQAQIAHRQGDQQKAVLWARRAKLEDDSLTEAVEFLHQIGDA